MAMTKLQRNLYKELLPYVDATTFNKGYNELIKKLPKPEHKYYTKRVVFFQGFVYGTPDDLQTDTLKEIFVKAGYKDAESDRTYKSYYKVLEQLYKLV